MTETTAVARLHAEVQFADELVALRAQDTRARPPGWQLSPWSVATYLLGGALDDGTEISPKYIGDRRLIEIAISTLATDRALLLLGVPGTAKTWVSEHLAAAISGDSTLLVQGTAGTAEEAIRYGWNYALLLAKGPSREALVPSPVMRAMQDGKLARVEELTRVPGDVQDTLITILSSGAGDLEPLFGMSIGFIVLYSIIDAGRRASIINQAAEGLSPLSPPEDIAIAGRGGSVVGGILIMGAGLLLLLHTRFDVSMEWLEDWWPALLILFGGYLLIKGIRNRD